MTTLLRTEAVERAGLITVDRYDLALDFTLGDEVFGSRVVIDFGCSVPGASTFVEFDPQQVESITLNDKPVRDSAVSGGRIWLDDLAAHNTLIVDARMAYVRDGEGMHRAVDPEDGNVYLYGSPASASSGKIYACFEQPDLKAPFDLRVTAPDDWVVVANGELREHHGRDWSFATTPPLATYFFTVCAGPYAVQSAEHDGVGMAVYARAALAEPLAHQAAEIFQVTGQCFDYYHSVYGIRYPWGKYDQVFVPEFNMGAMENPGCVTFRDEFIFRGQATRSERSTRAMVIAHEMAHMWFGDLVTMQWWDDLWLNESFAEFLGHQATADATEFDDVWLSFTLGRKDWGYAADRAPSTHPVAGMDAPDVGAALSNLDGITYPKGASALRQLSAYLGPDVFLEGVRRYLRAHEFGNASLADFLGEMSAASGQDLGVWTRNWLLTPGTDTLRATGSDGSTVLTRVPPQNHPAQRPHRLDVVGYRDGQRVSEQTLTLDDASAELTAIDAGDTPKLLLPNAADLTWAIVELDAPTQQGLPEQLPRVPDATARAVVWSSLVNGLAIGTTDPRLVLDTFEAAWPTEPNDALRSVTAGLVRMLLPGRYLSPAATPAALDVLARTGRNALQAGEVGASLQLTAARLVAATSSDDALLRGWLDGTDLPDFLHGDPDFRWAVISRLASLGQTDAEEIDQWLAADTSVTGTLGALAAKSRIPTAEAKQAAWDRLLHDDLSNSEVSAVAESFFGRVDQHLTAPYVARFFAEVPALADRYGEMSVQAVVHGGYPLTHVQQSTVDAAERALNSELSPGVRRALVDQTSVLREQLRSQQKFAS